MENISQAGLLILLSIFLVLHVCIIVKVIPYKMVWGGRLKSDNEMYRFETISIVLNLILIFIVLVEAGYINLHLEKRILSFMRWSMLAFFLFNTVSNALSKNKMEQKLFAPLTILMALFSLILTLIK
jgi:hypothetical protein